MSFAYEIKSIYTFHGKYQKLYIAAHDKLGSFA